MAKWIPFRLLPGSYHLTGVDYERAKARYLYEGTELDRKLLDLDYEPGSIDHQLQSLNIDHAEKIVDDLTYEKRRAEILLQGVELAVAIVEIEKVNGLLTDAQAEKKIATLRGKSWVGGPINYDGEGGVVFDLDWNEYWIEELRQNGYTGETDDDVMKKWFAALCYSEVIKEGGEDIDPFFYEVTRQQLNKLMNRND